jgi:transcriptional regulator with XRE-family HTH domain
MGADVGQLIRRRRRAHGITQAQLARRAQTSQAAISRMERGRLSPTVETLERVLGALGEEPRVTAARPSGDLDLAHLRDARRRTPAARLQLAISWNRLAGALAAAGRRARR